MDNIEAKLKYVQSLKEVLKIVEDLKIEYDKVNNELSRTMETCREFVEFADAATSVIKCKLSEKEKIESNHIGSKYTN